MVKSHVQGQVQSRAEDRHYGQREAVPEKAPWEGKYQSQG